MSKIQYNQQCKHNCLELKNNKQLYRSEPMICFLFFCLLALPCIGTDVLQYFVSVWHVYFCSVSHLDCAFEHGQLYIFSLWNIK
jgi:hypothetical protein